MLVESETKIMNNENMLADSRILIPKWFFILILPEVSKPVKAPIHADENINPNSLAVPLKMSIKAGKACIYPNIKKFVK